LPLVNQIDFVFGSPDISFTNGWVPATTVSDHFPFVASLLGPPTDSVLSAIPSTIVHEGRGGTDAVNLTFGVGNAGTGLMHYEITSQVGWITVSPTTGDSVAEADPITMSFDTDTFEVGLHEATITLTSPEAVNSPLTVPVQVRVRVPGDFDGDDDVDQQDFGMFQACLASNGTQTSTACQPARMDSDSDVDSEDCTLFRNCMTGPNVVGDAHCAQGQ
jgi:hypothetical protein